MTFKKSTCSGKIDKNNIKPKSINQCIYQFICLSYLDDQVSLDSEAERMEYVLNQTGVIFTGNSRYIRPKYWNFGQFSKSTLKTAMLLLEKSRVDTKAHGNATQVTRALSAMVSSTQESSVRLGPCSIGPDPTTDSMTLDSVSRVRDW